MDRVKSAIIDEALVKKGEKVLVALSGGADSTALLIALKLIADELDFSLCAAHFNHGIRSEAGDDERFCKRLCERIDIPFFSAFCDVPNKAKAHSVSVETAARLLRYEFLNETRKSAGAASIATAHHADDDAESILMHLFRGSGISGMTGIKYSTVNAFSPLDKTRGSESFRVIRPLLGIKKSEILAFLAERNQEFCFDKTNAEDDAARNYLRNRILPLIRENINPLAENNILRFKALALEDEEYLVSLARAELEKARLEDGFDKKLLDALPSPIKKRCLRLALDEKASVVDIEKKHIDMLVALLNLHSGAGIDLPAARARISFNKLIIEKINPQNINSVEPGFSIFEEGMRLEIKNGETQTPLGNFRLSLMSRTAMEKNREMVYNESVYGAKNSAFVDFDKLGGDIIVRSRRRGDRFHAINSSWNMKLKDFFVSRKVDERRRGSIPLVVSGESIIFIPGFLIADEVKITTETENILLIEYLGKNNSMEDD